MENGTATPFGFLGKIDAVIGRIEVWILGWGIILMAVNTIANVFGRYVFNQSIYFSEELNEFLIVIVTFMGLGYATRKGIHIRMSAIYDALPPSARKPLMVLIATVTAAAMFALCYFSIGYIIKVANSGRVLPALQLPVYWIFLWVPVGFFMTGLQYALTAIKNVFARDIYLSTQVLEGYDDGELEV